jgi:hypothetical protein
MKMVGPQFAKISRKLYGHIKRVAEIVSGVLLLCKSRNIQQQVSQQKHQVPHASKITADRIETHNVDIFRTIFWPWAVAGVGQGSAVPLPNGLGRKACTVLLVAAATGLQTAVRA